jgi:hypothetical protein
MRIAFGLLLALPLTLLVRTDSAQAQTYPWCAQYAIMGSINCGFVSLEQCNAALSGNGGYCAPNPFLRPGAELVPAAQPRR